MAMLRHLARGLLALPYVQLWETENSGRLDSSRRWGHRRAIPCLVDAPNLRTVNALRVLRVKSMSVMAIFRQRSSPGTRINRN